MITFGCQKNHQQYEYTSYRKLLSPVTSSSMLQSWKTIQTQLIEFGSRSFSGNCYQAHPLQSYSGNILLPQVNGEYCPRLKNWRIDKLYKMWITQLPKSNFAIKHWHLTNKYFILVYLILNATYIQLANPSLSKVPLFFSTTNFMISKSK